MPEMQQRALMLIADDPAQSRLVAAIAAREGWRTMAFRDEAAAVTALRAHVGPPPDAIVLDQSAVQADPCDLIAELKASLATVPILFLAAAASPVLAVNAMRAGASDYLLKPVAPDRLMHSLRAAAWRERWHEQLAPLTEKLPSAPGLDAMIGTAPAFRAALAVAANAARGERHVLVEGECGAGKEMVVRAMWAASPRRDGPMEIVDIGATPASSTESVLFGHERDAFPGAFTSHVGLLQRCDGGTLVIDEVDRLPMPVQLRLLEALRRRAVRPAGAKHGVRIDVRLITASNLPLADLSAQGQFLPELLDAIAPVTVVMPPLRERGEDIVTLTRHFLARIGAQPGLRELGVTDCALALLTRYDWPCNVRQLQAVLFRAAVFCDGDELTADDFPHLSAVLEDGAGDRAPTPGQGGSGVTVYTDDGNLRRLEDIELDVIRLAIAVYSGRMTEVARRLGIGRSTLYRKLGEIGIDNAA